ncbi:Unknown protein [Striga hermonthica]|uniref:Chromo domain-containing protein n=1 Tax=Striga hermonthica TaxID=68872 RepID=A0A9N7NJV4_STRHE|nr:Unknown protein [Striga hermonthica]
MGADPSNADLAKMIEALTGTITSLKTDVEQLKKDKGKSSSSSAGGYGDGQHHTDRPPRFQKMDFPRYDGKSDPLIFINRCESFFHQQRILEEEKVWMAAYNLEEGAQMWFIQVQEDEGKRLTWGRFKELINLRFGPPLRSAPLFELADCRRTGSVEDYQDRFQALLPRAGPLEEIQRVQLFIGGLLPPLSHAVRILNPQSLASAMSLARQVELMEADKVQAAAAPPPARAALPAPPRAERRRLGLCYNCNERYSRGHNRVCRRLFYIDGFELADDAAAVAPDAEAPVFSLHAVAGVPVSTTIQLPVSLAATSFIALVDSGSTHSFIGEAAARNTGLPVDSRPRLTAMVANGERVACPGVLRQAPVVIHGITFTVDLFVMPLAGYDVVLGTNWMAMLGPIIWDLAARTMAFHHAGRAVRWQGVPPLSAPRVLTAVADSPLLDGLLGAFSDVFEEPSGLPPTRGRDHCIVLKPGSLPVAVRPYRYPAAHKDELERQSLLKKDGFSWTEEAAAAFIELKTAVTTAPILAMPDFTKPFVVECDASSHGFGAVLVQDSHPVAYFSRPVTPRHRALAAYERELIGLVHAVRHWRPYLWGRRFAVKTDHYSLKYLLDQRLATIPQHHWVGKLLGFDFSVEYKPGHANAVADALSRRDTPEEGAVLALSAPRFDFVDRLRSAQLNDPALVALHGEINAGTKGAPWAIKDGMVLYSGRLYLPSASPLLLEIMAAIHDDGHEGVQRDRPRQWLQWLPWAEYIFNTAYQTSLRDTPFRVVYGRDPPTIRSYEQGDTRVAAVAKTMEERDEFLADIRARLEQAQKHQKRFYDRLHRQVTYEVGDWALLRLRHRAAASLPQTTTGKLKPKYYGPYRVAEIINEVAVRLELPARARLHDVFHIGLLKKFQGPPPAAPPPLPPVHHGAVTPEPAKAVKMRLARGVRQVLIQWKDTSPASATWEDAETFAVKYPDFQIEDDLPLEEGGDVMWGRQLNLSNLSSLSHKPAARGHNPSDEEQRRGGISLPSHHGSRLRTT